MRIEVRGRGYIAVPQPLLDFFQAHAVRIQQARATVSEIVNAYPAHTVLLQHAREMLRDISRFHKLPDVIDVDIFRVFLAIRTAAQSAVLFLLGFQVVQQFLKRRDKRRRPIAGFGLDAIFFDDGAFPV